MAIGSMTTNSTVDVIDKTLAVPGAPADAKAVGNIILDFTKETPQPIFYSKAEVDKLLADCKEAAKRAALLAANPVGKLWASDDPTSPASILGGTWERIKDRFILAAGDTYAAGSTGGEAEHTLSTEELPDRAAVAMLNASGSSKYTSGIGWGSIAVQSESYCVTSIYDYVTNKLNPSFTKYGQPHNNIPPYITMYVWKRIA